MKIEGGTHYILLHRDPENSLHSVYLFRRYDETISFWKAGDRVSPIFSVDKAEVPNLSDGGKRWVFFIGPMHPGKVRCGGKLFVSLGTFNVIAIAENEEENNSIKGFLTNKTVNWEAWVLIGHKIHEIQFNPKNSLQEKVPTSILAPIKIEYEELRASIFEYRAQIADTISRTLFFNLPGLSDLLRFDSLLRQAITHKKMPDDCVNKQGLLTIANSVLGRQSEQTFTGTSPIVETDGHIGDHSLLGLGVASLALRHIRYFIEKIFSKADIPRRMKLLTEVEATPESIYQMTSSDPFFSKDHLYGYPVQQSVDDYKEKADEVIPLLTSFSGRDGFRSTELSLSAPLAAVSGCNSCAWTLLTLTHEISHVIVQAVLAIILPHPDNQGDLEKAVMLFNLNSPKSSLFQRLREMTCFAFWVIDREGNIRDERIDTRKLSRIINDVWTEASEILTHVFDFLYFYRGDEKHYTRSIWVSWGVIPNIRERIPEYIIRTICALHGKNLRRHKERYQITIDQCIECLKGAITDFPESPYIKDAIDDLEQNRETYISSLKNRELLVKFGRAFLYSPEIQTLIQREPYISGGERGVYGFNVLEFSDILVQNPVRFVEEFSRDKVSIKQKSVWMLQQLAFVDELWTE